MGFLRHFFRFDHRMTRLPFTVIMGAAIVIGMVVGWSASAKIVDPNVRAELAHTMASHAKGAISPQDYQQQLNAIQKQAEQNTPAYVLVAQVLLLFFRLPALAMRLKDLNYPPALALLDPLYSAVLYWLAHSGISLPGYLVALPPLALLAVLVLMVFLRGTVGPNRYGPDPLQKTAKKPA